jgi:nuclear transport factor 2 (NTF2) superfamily protein
VKDEQFLRHVYRSFNAREIETVLAAMHQDVTWANGMEGGFVNGKDGVRNYWTRQWSMIDPHVEPVQFSMGPRGETIVRVHQLVRDLNGALLADREVRHIFFMEDGLIKRFEIGEG